MLVVQRIVTEWSKRARDASGREVRARLPVAYPLPDALLVARAACLNHYVSRNESKRYDPKHASEVHDRPWVSPSGFDGAVLLAHRDDHLTVRFCWSLLACGAPTRFPQSAHLQSGGVCRVSFIGRYTDFDTGSHWYEDKIVNVAFGLPLSRDMFLTSPPSCTLEARADLF